MCKFEAFQNNQIRICYSTQDSRICHKQNTREHRIYERDSTIRFECNKSIPLDSFILLQVKCLTGRKPIRKLIFNSPSNKIVHHLLNEPDKKDREAVNFNIVFRKNTSNLTKSTHTQNFKIIKKRSASFLI